MSAEWEIGKEARKLDEKTIIERMKIKGHSIKKIIAALLFYTIIMVIFNFIL
ncbi:MAG: hypothetical protein ACFE9Z_07990 [Promethearchaeota archaeon]